MITRISLIISLGCILSSAIYAQTPTARQKPDVGPAIDPRAVAALNKMSDFLKTVKTFKVNSEASTDEIVDTNMKVQKNAAGEIVIQLPAHAYARVKSDAKDFELKYDGQTLALYSMRHNYYATAPAPPTVKETLDFLRAKFDIAFPLADFVGMAAGENLLQKITAAGYLGASWIDGVECEHIAVRQNDVDWQVWIEKGDAPLPRKYVITTKQEATQPQYITKLTWDITPEISESMFTFTPPPNAERIQFAPVAKQNAKPSADRQSQPKKK